ncbi:MAG: AEC family transporter [Clostridia bacterium]|nr:AEC family transporter [Clostridia bacterium]
MENLIIAFNVVLPLMLCIMLGYFLNRIGMIGEALRKGMNSLCFKVFLPFYLFQSIYTTDVSASFNGTLMIFCCVAMTAWFALLMYLIPKVEMENPRRGVLIQAMFRSNFALFGLPMAESLCGAERMGPTSLLIGICVPLVNILAVITLESFRGGKPSIRKMLLGIAKNPLIIASVLGVVFNLLDIPLPSAVQKTITDLGRVATPLSLVALGASFTFASVAGYRMQLVLGVSGKLVICPLIMVTLGVLLGLRAEMLVPVLIFFGAPTAVSSFPMAQQMDGDGELAASLVVFTSALSILTIFLWVFVLKTIGLI